MLPSLNMFQNVLHAARDVFTPTLKSSQFLEKGQLTPEEFVAAGDYLIRMSPTWSWSRGEAAHVKSYLPAEKQYLKASNLLCKERVKSVGEDTHEVTESGEIVAKTGTGMSKKDDSYGDLADFMGTGADSVHDPATVRFVTAVSNEYRTYTINIVYDNVYRTPRVYLNGYDSSVGTPLTHNEMMEDIVQDYVSKTATIERHPHYSAAPLVSIHPCRHAQTMKRIIDTMSENGKPPGVELYMFIFLKFIASMIPTIDYDMTLSVAVSESK